MSKKIVIMPTFCDAHIIKYQIPNIIDTIDPDYIVYNEGLFPAGPESNTPITEDFLNKYTLDGHRGFDYKELEEIVEDAQKKYPNTKILLNPMKYTSLSAPQCYIEACTNWKELGINVEVGDYIFPYEPDVFHLERTKTEIANYLPQLQPDQGFRSVWLDFMETQHYVEKKNLIGYQTGGGRQRRICVRFGTMEFLKKVLGNFMTQDYSMLHPTSLLTYHYPWFKPGKYKELRYALIHRDPSYWQAFEKGLQQAKEQSIKWTQGAEKIDSDITIRPSSPTTSNNRYITFIHINHPKAIIDHPNFIK